jgi:hypothetical protein
MQQLRTALVASVAVCLTIGACKKGNETTTRTDTATGAIAPAASLKVTDVDLGRAVGADKRVTDKTDDFKPNDTIYASVHTMGTASSAKLTARWMFQDGQVVEESSQTIAPTTESDTEFHITKPGGWPKGKYTLHLLLDGNEVQTKDFEVK